MKRLMLAAATALSLTLAQAAWAEATQVKPTSLSGGDQTDFSTTVANCCGTYTATTTGGTAVQLYGSAETVDATGASFTGFLEFWQGDPSGNTSAFTNAILGLSLADANDVLITVYTDTFSNNFDYPTNLTAGLNTLAFAAISGEAISGISVELGAGASAELTSLTFDATPTVGAVPEPATWAMMLLGFGVVGGACSRRRRGVQAGRPKSVSQSTA